MISKLPHPETQNIKINVKTIFVEGLFDFKVLEILLSNIDKNIEIKHLGSVNFVITAAKAFKDVHPEYIYIIDRDYRDDKEVNQSWSDFKTGKSSYIIWRKRELENYFIDPKYLINCKYLKREYQNIDKLSKLILKKANEIIFHSAAEIMLQRQYNLAKNVYSDKLKFKDFETKESALKSLEKMQKIVLTLLKNKSDYLKKDFLINKYKSTLNNFYGDKCELDFGNGSWIELIDGKKILSAFMENCMENYKRGKEPEFNIIRSVIRKNEKNKPNDFTELKKLIRAKVSN